MKLIDISPVVSPRIAVWPGDHRYRQDYAVRMRDGGNLDLSSIHTTVHVGAHADGPSHYLADGAGIGARDLGLYYGPCQVISVSVARGARIAVADVDAAITAPRVLFCTGSFPDPEHWNSDFNSLSPALVHWLAGQGVVLVGVDTPSVDPQHSKALESHNAIASHDMAVLEGLVLAHVPPGPYTLIALPLKLEGADASPVRAALVAE